MKMWMEPHPFAIGVLDNNHCRPYALPDDRFHELQGRPVKYVYDLIDRFDPTTKTHSMARTTGYTATAAVRMLASGLYQRTGICPPEYIGQQPECVEFILEKLKERGVIYNETIETSPQPVL